MDVSPFLAFLTFIFWLGLLLLPWCPWATTESLDALPPTDEDLSDVTALVPARDEFGLIQLTLQALAKQGRNHQIILIDDQSDDGTPESARALELPNLKIVTGQPLVPNWTGKLWALEQGRQHVQTPLTLLLDADIALEPRILGTLRAKMKTEGLQLVSLMAHLQMAGFWEKLLMPAFVYFFKLIYPFSLSNRPNVRWVAAAAGGCILIESRVLQEIGGFGVIKDTLIDDCALARAVKSRGGKTWIGLTHSAVSVRPYRSLNTIWHMVERTAFTQLGYSFTLLALCTLVMTLAFLMPVAGLWVSSFWSVFFSGTALFMMMFSYGPTLRYYELSGAWSLALPLVGLLYLAMTWTSAVQFLLGKRSSWKGRIYSKQE